MIVRPQQHWLRRIFVWHGSVLSKISSRLLLNFLFSIAVIFMLPWYTHLGIKFTLAPFSILGVAIAIFLGFRNNAGYARYVEARKLWGQLMIASRSLLREVKTTLPDSASVREFARLQIAFAHCLRMTLRKQPQAEVLAQYLKTEDLQRVLASNSPANRILLIMGEWLAVQRRNGQLSDILFISLNDRLNDISAVLAGCERIAYTPIPFAYTLMVGELTKLANGAHTFKYAPEWLASRYARPLSLSLPLQRRNITSDAVFKFFDNLLPDSPIVRDRIVKRYHAKSRQPFDLLSEIGRDSVGAVTLIPEDETVTCPIMAWEKLTEARLEEVLTAYKADIPLGMIREENDFRISVAGAQEKTALLRIGNDWCIPKGITPTTHIIKLPIGEIRQPNATLDLSQSVDNEYYCLLLAKELGLNVPDAEIIKAGRVRALAVERFDRRWNTERTVLLRLPQEDMCQTFGLPSSVKYESDGGPGIAQIMAFLMGSSEALKDRYDFMKFQVFQWLIGATDGHAKNFSVFIQAGGSYRLTPFYDIISAFPVLGGTGIHISDLKLAMGLNASKGKKTAIDKIYPQHFLATAKVLKFPEVQMHEILSDFARMIPAALDNVKNSLPTDFPENVVTAVETNVLRLHGRLSREYGIK